MFTSVLGDVPQRCHDCLIVAIPPVIVDIFLHFVILLSSVMLDMWVENITVYLIENLLHKNLKKQKSVLPPLLPQ